jgi:hypothetical protein
MWCSYVHVMDTCCFLQVALIVSLLLSHTRQTHTPNTRPRPQDVASYCAGLCPQETTQPCGGAVLQCLTDHQTNLTSPACQEVGWCSGLALSCLFACVHEVNVCPTDPPTGSN